MGIYTVLVKQYKWSLKAIDETNLNTLLGFIYHKKKNPNTKVINGKKYKRRAPGVVPWL